MPKYNIFDECIANDVKEKHNLLMAETKALFDASNILSEAINSLKKPQKEIAKYLNISEGYLSRLLSGNENISLKNFAKILYKLGFELQILSVPLEFNNTCKVVWMDFGKSHEPDSVNFYNSTEPSKWENSTFNKAV